MQTARTSSGPLCRQSALVSLLLAGLLLSLPGCSGCSQDPLDGAAANDAAKAEKDGSKKKEKPKPDFEAIKLTVIPQKVNEGEARIRFVKPGHLTAAVEETKANNYDFVGDLFAEVREEGLGKAADLERTPHKLSFLRPAALAKGVPKHFEMMFYVPGNMKKAWLASELRSHAGGVAATPGPEPLTLARPYQYNLVVLGAEADRYRPWEDKDSIKAPHPTGNNAFDDNNLRYYDIIPIPAKKPVPLPSSALAWTTIAYVVWDDFDPSLLTPEQQSALVDWLHWGGQLIISGPKSLDQLRGKSFLGSYLPALPGEPRKISAETLKPLSEFFTVGKNERPLAPVADWSGIELVKQGDAEFLEHTNDLVVERQIGRGRIVATAFRLTERALVNWPGFDGFLNSCLLRRPPREFSRPNLGEPVIVDWYRNRGAFDDPSLTTGLRYLSRDWDEKYGYDLPPSYYRPRESQKVNADGRLEIEAPTGPGIAAWSDFNSTANAARDSLRAAAGIVIPKSDWVVWMLVCYLAVLVPLNWLVFRVLRRVEWAWIAAPIIALGAMAVVVKEAQLNIGFARSQTELAVLEMQNGYPRGHLTRYTALYTSLSTTYDVNAEDSTAFVMPFAAKTDFTPLPGQSFDTVTLHTDPKIQLTDFPVSSNSTAMLHGEQMFDLGGGIAYSEDKDELSNNSKYDLARAAILRRTADDKVEWAWVGNLAAGSSIKLSWKPVDNDGGKHPEWNFELAAAGVTDGPKLSLEGLAKIVRNAKLLEPGETRLVGLIEQPLPGLNVEPAASQTGRGATLVVCNLTHPQLELPKADVNSRRDFGPDINPEEQPETPAAENAAAPAPAETNPAPP
jgi:hypothetical protein